MLDWLKKTFATRWTAPVLEKEPPHIVGVTLGFDLRPHLAFSDGTILYGNTDKIFYPEYWPENWKDDKMAWPIDPKTGDRLPIA